MVAIPRYSASVPIVTASDGSPSRVTSRPLKAPAASPTIATITKMAGIGKPLFHSTPRSALAMPRIEATDRSISPLMMISVIGSVMIAISPLDGPTLNRLFPVRNCGDTDEPTMMTITTTAARPVSQRSAGRSRSMRLCMTAPSFAQGAGEAHRDGLVERDRHDEQEAPDRLVPERGDAEHVQCRGDRGQQQRAQRRPDDAAAAAEDRDAADHHGGDGLEFVAGAGAGVDRPVLRGPQHAGDAGDGAADRERGEHAPPDGDAGQPCRLGVRSDGVQFPAGPVRPQVVHADPDHHRDRDGHVGDAEGGRPGYLQEGVGQRGGNDLLAAEQQDVDPADDVQRAERHHQAGHPARAHHEPVGHAARQADAKPGQEHHRDGDTGMRAEQVRGRVRGQAEHRSHRQVHVPADHDHCLAEREQGDHGGVDQHELDVRRAEEPGLDGRGDRHEDGEDDENAGFPDPEDPLDEGRAAGPPGGLVGPLLAAGAQDRPHFATRWPMAADMMDSSEASSRLNSAISAPSRITRMRSLTPRTSGSSEEIISTPTPLFARPAIKWCTSALVPTSMPRVGSSTISTAGLRPSHLASTTFCWLPPDSMDTGSVSRPYLIFSRVAQSVAIARSAEALISPPLASRPSEASATFCSTDMSMTRPCCRRSSGTNPTPAAIAVVGDALRSCWPRTVTEPASYLSMPKMARATSLRPEPTSPASATISPARTVNEMSVNTPSRVSRPTVSTGSPGVSPPTSGGRSASSLPTIARTRSAAVRPARSLVSTWLPSRITVTRVQIVNTSSSRCEMNSTAAPWSRSVRITSKSRPVSAADSAAVGSSITITRASRDSALPISTTCWSAMDRPRAIRAGSSGTPSRLKIAAASPRIARRSIRRPDRSGWRPMNMFSATVRSGNSVGSW